MSQNKILIVEDDNRLRKTLALEFREKLYEVNEADSLETIPEKEFDFALVDMRLHGTSGLKVIEKIKECSPVCKIIAITGYGSIATAVEAMKLGAMNYLTKPVDIEMIERAFNGESVTIPEKDSPISLSRKEHEYIEYMLNQNDGNIAKTARALGLHRQSLQRKLKKRP